MSFTDDLPAEIRLMIYKYCKIQVSGHFFELWNPRHNSGHLWTRNGFPKYARFRKPLRLLRLCRKVHGEIAEMFYSKQNFRFSDANGMQMLAAWMYTIKARHFQYLQHITVQIPVRDDDQCIWTPTKWTSFAILQARRGMNVPNYRYRSKHYIRNIAHGEHCYGKAMARGFKYLASIPELKKLEFTVPWDYQFIPWNMPQHTCTLNYLEMLDPVGRVKHVIEDHSDADFWKPLADLKQKSQSKDLTIAFVLLHGPEYSHEWVYVEKMCAARWLAAYAKVQGYKFGHARWEDGTYQVRYDEDDLLILKLEGRQHYEPPGNLTQGSGLLWHSKTSGQECRDVGQQLRKQSLLERQV